MSRGPEPLIYRKGKRHDKDRILVSPPILVDAQGPRCHCETNTYSNRFCLMQHEHEGTLLSCDYGHTSVLDYKPYLRVFQIRKGLSQTPKYTMQYDAAIGGIKAGSTTVKSIDGTITVYEFSDHLLPTATRYYHPDGTLCKKLTYHWLSNHWLDHIDLTDAQGVLIYKKSYTYDRYGNPIKEELSGNLSGEGTLDSKEICRTYSQDGKHLLLEEKLSSGRVTRWQYLPNTNLPLSKTIDDGLNIIESHFFEYDDCNNLIKERVSNGPMHAFTKYVLRQEQPFLHMPEWIEKGYLEDGTEKILSRKRLTYDCFGNVCQEDYYDNAQQYLYSIKRTYNKRGNLLSETNALGQTTTHEYDAFGRCITSTSPFTCTQKEYDAQGNLLSETLTGKNLAPQKTKYSYDLQDRLIGKEDYRGNQYKYHYDPISNEVIKTESPSVNNMSVVTSSTYNALGQRTSKTDANGHKTQFEYNILGSLTKNYSSRS